MVESCTQFVWTERSFIKFHSTAVKQGPWTSSQRQPGKSQCLQQCFINQNTSTALENFPFGPTTTESLFSVQTVTASEVKSVLKSLPSKISTGVDKISYRLSKEAGPGVVGPLTTLFNISLCKRQVPEEWKRAVVLPIFKGGNRAGGSTISIKFPTIIINSMRYTSFGKDTKLTIAKILTR